MRPSSRVRATFFLALLIGACGDEDEARPDAPATPEDHARAAMVRERIAESGVESGAVLRAMGEVPRHEFVPADQREFAYEDRALPIGHDQRTSRPSLVAIMTELAELKPGSRVLEVGTGSGYAAAVLSRIAAEVYTIEIIPSLGERARGVLADLGYDNVHVRVGDGYQGWPDQAPFDAVIITAAPPKVPQPLLDQLAPGGRLVVPEGEVVQQLVLYIRRDDEKGTRFERKPLIGVRFVPMTGEVRRR